MRRLATIAVSALTLAPLFAHAACPTFHQLQNGTVADASQVMDNYNNILSCPNFNVASGQTFFVSGNNGGARPGFTMEVVGPGAVDQVNITSVLDSWGLLLGSDPSSQTASVYHGPQYSYVVNVQNAPLVLGANNSAVMTVSNNGYVGIGTTTPAWKLDVVNTSAATPIASGVRNLDTSSASSDALLGVSTQSGGGEPYVLYNAQGVINWTGGIDRTDGSFRFSASGANPRPGTSDVVTISYSGAITATSFTQTSDARVKRDIAPLADGALGTVLALKPVTYRWKDPHADSEQGQQIGFVAQDVEKLLPSAVRTGSAPQNMKSLNYIALIPVLTKAMQEQQAAIQEEHTAMQAQAREIKELKDEVAGLASAAHKQRFAHAE